jgi:hypothetical protein
MTLKTLQNFYKAVITTGVETGTGVCYVSVLPTPTEGYLVINPSNVTKREIIAYNATGTDDGGYYVTMSERGVGGTTEQAHDVNEPVRLNLTAEYYADIQTELALKLDDSQLDTDGTLAANSDTKIASQKATKTYTDTGLALKVNNTGNETIAGIKTFSSSPIVPAPTIDLQVATKKYADDLTYAGAPDADEATKGVVEQATAAEVNAGTETGGTSAKLFVSPNLLKAFVNFESSTGVTHSLTTTAGQTVVVWAKGDAYVDGNNLTRTITLKYGGVTKDTVNAKNMPGDAADNKYPFSLMYTETPGAGTANITVEISGDSVANVVIIVAKLGI